MIERHLASPGPMDNWRQVADAVPVLAEPVIVAAEVRHLPRLAAAFARAEAKARELGLIGDKGAADE
jgi:hypothetical protein